MQIGIAEIIGEQMLGENNFFFLLYHREVLAPSGSGGQIFGEVES